ncbi:uncharacterized protein LOC110440679 [Mizuhopecten yessoensis]|uniref:uncharacterized protein LOC110440679 n=1 Tax=Mizuhopecten yessoensis TaxID=6573 RepID=UPI000B4574E3|nr:uncharacterized protein LOC110440679 [Mizuhopecten yessoensis]
MARNSRDLLALYDEISSGVNEEVNFKYNNIRSAVLQELKPFVQFVANNIRGIQQDVTSLTGIIDCAEFDTEQISQYLIAVISECQNLASWMETTASTRVSYPMKDTVDVYIVSGRDMLQVNIF